MSAPNAVSGSQGSIVSFDLGFTPLAQVRTWVRDLMREDLDVLVEDAVQVTDELVSNAHRHGRGPLTCRLIRLHDAHGSLRIEVDDTSPGEPRIRKPDPSGGSGLVLVDSLANAWGVAHRDGHKTVWAELIAGRPTGEPTRPDAAARSGAEAPHWYGLQVTRRWLHDAIVVSVAGEVDLDTAPSLAAAITDGLKHAGNRSCIVDLTRITFLDSRGLTALASANRQAQNRRKDIRLVVDTNRTVIKPLRITGLGDTLPLYRTIDDAARLQEPIPNAR